MAGQSFPVEPQDVEGHKGHRRRSPGPLDRVRPTARHPRPQRVEVGAGISAEDDQLAVEDGIGCDRPGQRGEFWQRGGQIAPGAALKADTAVPR